MARMDKERRKAKRKRVKRYATGGSIFAISGKTKPSGGGVAGLSSTNQGAGQHNTVGGNVGLNVNQVGTSTLQNISNARTSFPEVGAAAAPLTSLGNRLAG